MSRTFEVEIYGQRYAIKGEAEQAYVEELARQVDEQMRAVAAGMKSATPSKVAVLTALNLAHELQQARTLHDNAEQVDKLAEGLIDSIEETLGGTK